MVYLVEREIKEGVVAERPPPATPPPFEIMAELSAGRDVAIDRSHIFVPLEESKKRPRRDPVLRLVVVPRWRLEAEDSEPALIQGHEGLASFIPSSRHPRRLSAPVEN